jgi:hypothetical protein
MWPIVDPGPGPWTPESVVAVGERVVIARGKRAGMVIIQGGLGACFAILAGAWHFPWPLRLEIAGLILVAAAGVGAGSLWAWNAIVVPRWWDWAVRTGVDYDRLVMLAKGALLIVERDPWWRARRAS